MSGMLEFRHACFVFALVAAVQPTQAIAEKPPLVFAPSSQWVLDYADDHCALRRAFSDGEENFYIEFRQFTPNNAYDLSIMASGRNYDKRRVHYRFAPHEFTQKFERALPLESNAGHSGVLTSSTFGPPTSESDDKISTPPSDADITEWAAKILNIEISEGFGRSIILETGPMNEALLAMSNCIEELTTHWGVDWEAHQNLKSGAAPRDIKKWAVRIQEEYPSKAIRKGYRGPVRIWLLIDREGQPTKCEILAEIANPVLSESACRSMLKYAEFDPAIDANGNPIESYYITTITYWLN